LAHDNKYNNKYITNTRTRTRDERLEPIGLNAEASLRRLARKKK